MSSSLSWRVGSGLGLRSSVLAMGTLDGAMSDGEDARAAAVRGEVGVGGVALGNHRARKQDEKMRRADEKARKEWKNLSSALDVLLEAGIGACSLPDAQGYTPPMLAASASAFPGAVLVRLLKACPNAGSALNLHARTVLHELCRNRAATAEAVYCVTEAHQAATLSADVEGNMPLHLVCSANGDRPDLIQAVLRGGSAAARRTNKDGKLPLHVLTAHFAHDDNIEALKLLLAAFPEGAEVADDFGCLPVDLLPRQVKVEGGAECFITYLVEAIHVDISISAHELVRTSLLPAPATGRRDKDEGPEATLQADAKLKRLAQRCDMTTEDSDDECERRASQLDTVELMAALRKQRLPVGHEHVSSHFWAQRSDRARVRCDIRGEENEEQMAMESSRPRRSGGMQPWHPRFASDAASTSTSLHRRSSAPTDYTCAAPPGTSLEPANRRARMIIAAAKHPPHWGTATDALEPEEGEEEEEEAVYLISGKKRVLKSERSEELSSFQHSAANPRRRSRSRSRGRSKTRANTAASAAVGGPHPAPQRGRHADPSVKAAGMLTGRDSVSCLLQQEHLGHVHVGALDKTGSAQDKAVSGGKLRQSVTSSARTRSLRHSAETPVSRSFVTLEDFKGRATPLPLTASSSAAAASKRVSMASGTSILSRASGASERTVALPHRSRTLSPTMYSNEGIRGGVAKAAGNESMTSTSQRVPPTSDEFSQRLSRLDFGQDALHLPHGRGSALGLASVEVASCTTTTARGTSPVSVEAMAGFRHGTKERFDRFEPLWGTAPSLGSGKSFSNVFYRVALHIY
jgi:hypothetical protein